MTSSASLPAITALARAGAVARAWELYCAAGHGERSADPAAQAVHGRLLKDRARLAHTDERGPPGAAARALFAEAAAAYAAADALAPAPYLAINAATCALLAGDSARAEAAAHDVLARLDAPEPPADTPYFLAATRAEALLLLGRRAEAETALAIAARADPDGWADRARTLAQLREICAARGETADWLARFAPPASLHFIGHMGIAAAGTSEAALAAAAAELIARERVGFGFGALAAGADIVIAEALVAAGAELHVALPCPPDVFEAQSVTPAGPAWTARYRALIVHARSLQIASPGWSSAHDPLATELAGEIAIGAALLNARQLGARALQFAVFDPEGGGENTARLAALWAEHNLPGERLIVRRDAAVETLFPPETPDPGRALVVFLAIAIGPLLQPKIARSDHLAHATAPISAALAPLGREAVRAAPGRWDVVLTDLESALFTIAALQRVGAENEASRVSIGAHFGFAALVPDPASGALIAYGPGADLAERLRAMAPEGVALASEVLAVSMVANQAHGARGELYHPGDEGSEGPVYILLTSEAD